MRSRLLSLLLVAGLAGAVYFNTLGNEFVYDDGAQILRNHYIRDTSHLRRIFTTNVWSFLGPHAISNYYRPVQHLVYMADYALYGYVPAGYHATNVIFHAANSVLVLLLAEALLFPAGVPLLAGLLFAAHPIGTEAVAWVAAIPEQTYAFFWLLALLAYVRARPLRPRQGASPRRRAWLLAASSLAALLALFSKETALMLPAAVALYEHGFRHSAEPHWRRPAFYAGHLAALLFYVVMRVISLGGFQVATNPYGVLPAGQFVLSVIYLVGKYIAKLFVPAPFNIFHVFHPARGLADWRVLGGAALLAAIGAAAWLLWRKQRPLAYAIPLLLLPLVPVLDLRAIGHNIFTERYLYLPAAGFCWLLAAALMYVYRRRRLLAIGLVVLLLANYAALTAFRNRDWHDDVLLYTVTLQVSPESSLIRDNLGQAFLEGFGRPDLALELFRECVRRAPESAPYRYQLALAYGELRRYDEALGELQKSLELWSNYPEAYCARGDIYRERGDLEAAWREYQRALQVKPTYAEVLNAAGSLLEQQGRLAQAEQYYRRALQVTDLADAHLSLGLLFLQQSRFADAEREFRQVLVSQPHSVPGWHGLGNALRALRRNQEAMSAYRKALQERPWVRTRRLGRPPLPDLAVIQQALDGMGSTSKTHIPRS